MKKILTIFTLMAVGFVAIVAQRYYAYVTNVKTPFDEVGISLNGYMPAPIHDWGCAKLKETFGTKTLPPHGCSKDGKNWQ